MTCRLNRTVLVTIAAALVCVPTHLRAQSGDGLDLQPGTFRLRNGPVTVAEGTLSVPANRSDTASGTIPLRFVIFQSTGSTPGPAIVFLAGGPGDAGIRAFRGIPEDFLAALRERGDVIALDQRGTGLSGPPGLRCTVKSWLPLDAPGSDSLYIPIFRARVAACLEEVLARGVDVAGLTTRESADDLELLNRRLGSPGLVLLGGSYGTHLAIATARRHPDAVRGLILAGVEGPDQTFKLPLAGDRALARFDATRAEPGLRTLAPRVLEALSRRAVSVSLDRDTVTVGPWDLRRMVADALGSTRALEALGDALERMLADDYTDLARHAFRFRRNPRTDLLNIAMDCASWASPGRLARIRQQADSSLPGTTMDFPKPYVCDVPGLPRLDETFRQPLVSRVPALLISGRFDGRTPPGNAEDLAEGLPHARSMIVDDAAHDLLGRSAVMDAIIRFVQDLPRGGAVTPQ